jgi:hypothetical protein
VTLSRVAVVAVLVVSGPASAQMVISEVMADPLSLDDHDEFIELFNASGGAMDIDGWSITDGDDVDTIEAWNSGVLGPLVDGDVVTDTTLVPAGGFAVILDREYNDAGAGASQPYDFPSGTVVVTLDDTTIGSELTESDPVTLYDDGGTSGADVVDTYGTPMSSDDPLLRDDDGLDGIPLSVAQGNSAQRLDPNGSDEESNWIENIASPGQLESAVIFADGFESGGISRWSDAMP